MTCAASWLAESWPWPETKRDGGLSRQERAGRERLGDGTGLWRTRRVPICAAWIRCRTKFNRIRQDDTSQNLHLNYGSSAT